MDDGRGRDSDEEEEAVVKVDVGEGEEAGGNDLRPFDEEPLTVAAGQVAVGSDSMLSDDEFFLSMAIGEVSGVVRARGADGAE